MPENSKKNSPAEHLKPHQFQPGQSGNPGGRPKKKPLTDAIMAELAKDDNLSEVAKKFVQMMKMGKVEAVKEVWDRLEGKVATTVNANVNTATEEANEYDELLDEELERELLAIVEGARKEKH